MAKRGGGGHLQIKMCYFIHLKTQGKIANTGKTQGISPQPECGHPAMSSNA